MMEKNELFTNIIKDLTRRKKEILDISSIAEDINNINYYYHGWWKKRVNPNYHQLKPKNEIIIKSTILIFYSHWEWLVKFCWKKYIEFLKTKWLKRNEIDAIFIEHFIWKNKQDLNNLFEVLLDNKEIPIDDDIVKNILNLDYDWLESFFKKLWLSFDIFIKIFEEELIKNTWLEKWTWFKERVKHFKKWTHFLVDYIETNQTSINWRKTLEKIIKVDKNNPTDIWLVYLRHKIAHWADNVNISYKIFKNLSNITELLIDIFIKSFKQQINIKHQ